MTIQSTKKEPTMSTVEQRETFLRSYERRENLKECLKKETKIFKSLNEEMHTFLLSQTEPAFEHANYRVAFRKHRKPAGGLTWEVAGTGYLAFQKAHGRLQVDEAEKIAFIAFVKAMLQSKTREEIQLVDVVANVP